MLLRRRRGSVRPRARRGRLRRWSRAGGRARKASAPILACGAPGGVPSRAPGEGCCPPWPSAKKLSRAGGESGKSIEHNSPRPAESRKSLRLGKSGANDDCAPSRSKRLAQHTARVRAAGFRASRRVRRVRDATPCPRRAVSPRGARRRFPPRRTRQSRTRHLVFFCYLVRVSRIFARKKTRRRDPRSARARALVADTPILPPAPVPPAVARAPSSRAPRPSAAAPPRPRARANAHRKTDGSSAKTPSQRRGSRAMAPRGGRACPAENAEWNPTRGNL